MASSYDPPPSDSPDVLDYLDLMPDYRLSAYKLRHARAKHEERVQPHIISYFPLTLSHMCARVLAGVRLVAHYVVKYDLKIEKFEKAIWSAHGAADDEVRS